MAVLHLLHGLPGSGKSTFGKTLEQERRALRLALDDWMVPLFGIQPDVENFQSYVKRIEALQWNLAERLLALGMDVVWDYGLWTRESRLQMKQRVQRIGAEAVFYAFDCPATIADARVLARTEQQRGQVMEINQEALDLFRTRFEPVTDDEGWEVITISTGL